MKLLDRLTKTWADTDSPFLIHCGTELKFSEIAEQQPVDLSSISAGDVVALIGDFDPASILTLLRLIDLGVIVVPLSVETAHEHEYFFQTALVDAVIHRNKVVRRESGARHELVDSLRQREHAGLVLFSTGTTGRPKAILHDLTLFLRRFETPRPALRTLNFLLFDHIGGINTLLHTLFNRGVVVAPEVRTVDSVLDTCRKYEIEVLPTTPTFLRLMLMSGAVPRRVPDCLKVITYGTERMDQPTLDALCELLPSVDFRQTFGMSELGIVRVKSEARNSLFMRIGGEGVETRIVDNVLQIRSESRMLGYLNAPSPFDAAGWYNTHDVVESKGSYFRVVGRTSDVINVAGLKFMASEVERVALGYPDLTLVKAIAKQNPITGQHVELLVQPAPGSPVDSERLLAFLKGRLQPHMMPKRIRVENIAIGHRFKRT
ncbi:long-chain fatty acid--CoA ligase [Ramlibacter sp. AW1]|uniref:Long-chain fatty acid--CoA ligase n=1 Tax=Ramlibacter aurantiacus TaxID=2801330 RepID=A0A936ZNM8_9BURK|nr:fatty acid--CoA ligase family protein [Ramlibacter aurantiacus]MBL0419561.1 long-chain fatty acid--CoA ligase [Ramlibacter aurantiacus]